MNTQSFTNGTSRLSRAVRRQECGTHPCYELSTSQFSDMKVRRLTRQYGFSGYSIYRYLVNETLHNGSYLLLWCEETAQAVASYWNASLETAIKIQLFCFSPLSVRLSDVKSLRLGVLRAHPDFIHQKRRNVVSSFMRIFRMT